MGISIEEAQELTSKARRVGILDTLTNIIYWMRDHHADYNEFNDLVNYFEDLGFISARDNEVLQAYWSIIVLEADPEEVL